MAVDPLVYPPGQGKAAQNYARLSPRWTDTRVLAANTNQTHTVPDWADTVFFGSDDVFFAKKNGAASVPSGTTTDGTGSEANPGSWTLKGDPDGDTTSIGLISPYTCIVTLTFARMN